MGTLFIAVVLWIPDGIVGTLGNWLRKWRAGHASQIREEAGSRSRATGSGTGNRAAAEAGDEQI